MTKTYFKIMLLALVLWTIDLIVFSMYACAVVCSVIIGCIMVSVGDKLGAVGWFLCSSFAISSFIWRQFANKYGSWDRTRMRYLKRMSDMSYNGD